MQNDGEQDDGPGIVTNRTMEIVVALILIAFSAIVIFDSNRIGFGWQEGQGPAPGYFPFWIAVILGIASLVNLYVAISKGDAGGFVSGPAFKRVLAVLVPTAVYIALIGGVGPIAGLGIYVASFLFITAFMLVAGSNGIVRSVVVGAAIPIVLFFMFERWFLVPLPKGPLEAALGFG